MRLQIFIFFVVLMSVCGFRAEATHIVGGEMTYIFISANPTTKTTTYRIRLDIYQDCFTGDQNAIAQDNPAYIAIFTGDGQRIFFGNRPYDSIYQSTFLYVPPNFSNSCVKNPPPTCLRKVTFTKDYTLPNNTSGYKVVYQRCCRNGTIVNIANPGGVGASYYCSIPPAETSLKNNSAVFSNYPPQIICINNPLVYDHSAVDPDGDSLSYEFCDAYVGGEPNDAKPVPAPPPYKTVTYIGSYKAIRPMAGNPLVQINPNTGMITGTPNILGRFVVTVCCHEWKNGVMVNTVTREFQFVVTNCSKAVVANIPQYSTDFNTYIVQCKSRTVTFKNLSTGGFAYHWDFGVPGVDSDTSADFEPTFTYPDSGVYTVKLLVNKGSTCPDSITRLVKVFPTFKTDFVYGGLHCPNSEIVFTDLSEATYKPLSSWEWSFGDGNITTAQNPKHVYTQGGNYEVVLVSKSLKGCTDTMKKNVFIENFMPRAGNDTIIVKGEYVNFNATGGISYTWTPATYLNNPNIANPTGFYPDTTRLDYVVHVKSAYDCEGNDTMNVWVVGQPSVFVPSAFTPNGDGKNDELKPIGIGYRNVEYFRVFNRWGQKVYFSDRFKVGWDGTFNGAQADVGTYFWQLKLIDRNGKEEYYKGDAELIR